MQDVDWMNECMIWICELDNKVQHRLWTSQNAWESYNMTHLHKHDQCASFEYYENDPVACDHDMDGWYYSSWYL